MKTQLVLLVVVALANPSNAFQFMSKWKVPTHDPNREKIQEKFGDKSKLSCVGIYMCVRITCAMI